MGHVAIGTFCANPGAVAVVDGSLQPLIGIAVHLVATNTELLRVGDLQGDVEAAPEYDAGEKSPPPCLASTILSGHPNCRRTDDEAT